MPRAEATLLSLLYITLLIVAITGRSCITSVSCMKQINVNLCLSVCLSAFLPDCPAVLTLNTVQFSPEIKCRQFELLRSEVAKRAILPQILYVDYR